MEISGPANLNSKDSTVWHFKMWALAALTGDCINDGFSYENVWPFCRAEKKWPKSRGDSITEVAVRWVSTVLSTWN